MNTLVLMKTWIQGKLHSFICLTKLETKCLGDRNWQKLSAGILRYSSTDTWYEPIYRYRYRWVWLGICICICMKQSPNIGISVWYRFFKVISVKNQKELVSYRYIGISKNRYRFESLKKNVLKKMITIV